jgi:hypothetical protein
MLKISQELVDQMINTGITFVNLQHQTVTEADIDCIENDEKVTHDWNSYTIWTDLQKGFMVKLNYAQENDLKLVVYFNTDSISHHVTSFSVLKRISEQKMGVHSMCLNLSTAHDMYSKRRELGQYMANAAMNVNLKLGNTNHSINQTDTRNKAMFDQYVDRSDAKTGRSFLDLIILCADVTHTQRESAVDMPSLAVVVRSVDDTFGKFLGSMRDQGWDEEVS